MTPCIYVVFRKRLFKDHAFVYFTDEESAKKKVKKSGKRYYYKAIYQSMEDEPMLFMTLKDE